jgi:hypothetical protein
MRWSLNVGGRDYSRYNLKANPFPYTPVPNDDPEIFVGQDRVLERLTEIISTCYTSGSSGNAVIIGPYGSGKSHAMKYLRKIIRTHNFETRNELFVCYISSLGQSFLNIYQEFMEQLGHKSFTEAVQNYDMKDTPYNILTIIQNLLDEDNALDAWRWILGEKLESSARSQLGISRNIDEMLALNLFQITLKCMMQNGVKLVCLLIDELETVNELYPYQRQSLFNNLRRMIDENTMGLCTIFSCTPNGWDEIMGRSLALTRRVSRNIIYMNRLSRDDTRQVIEEHMKNYRLYDVTENTLYPFTDDSLETLYEVSQGNIGELVKYCNQIIDSAMDQGLPQITSSDITMVLK